LSHFHFSIGLTSSPEQLGSHSDSNADFPIELDTIDNPAMNNLDASQPAIRVVMMPRDTNSTGTIFGGIILSYIDQAGAVEAHKHTSKNLATVAMHEVKFIAPVFVGDLVSFYTELLRIGTTSITVRVTVDAMRRKEPHETVRVTHAEVVYVAIGEPGKSVPIK
jgi:acyl-CoA thioesterase YciA